VVHEPDAATKRALQNNQLMSERGILSLKPDLRLEQRGQHGKDKPDEPDQRGNLADSSLNKPELGFRYTQVQDQTRLVAKQVSPATVFCAIKKRWSASNWNSQPTVPRLTNL
jgi:hypothetical protein